MRLVLTFCMLCLLAVPVHAAFQGSGTLFAVISIAEAKKAVDETHVMLEGTIVEKLAGHDDKYRFKDDVGDTIIVEIDDEVFDGRTVTPSIKIRITGEVDAERLRDNEIDVKRIDIL